MADDRRRSGTDAAENEKAREELEANQPEENMGATSEPEIEASESEVEEEMADASSFDEGDEGDEEEHEGFLVSEEERTDGDEGDGHSREEHAA